MKISALLIYYTEMKRKTTQKTYISNTGFHKTKKWRSVIVRFRKKLRRAIADGEYRGCGSDILNMIKLDYLYERRCRSPQLFEEMSKILDSPAARLPGEKA